MLGWMILFALIAVTGAILAAAGYPGFISARTTSLIFALLFLISVFTWAVRGRAR